MNVLESWGAVLPREWLLTTDIYGNSLHQCLTIFVKGEDVTGILDGDALMEKCPVIIFTL
jgi:hypothetical protein